MWLLNNPLKFDGSYFISCVCVYQRGGYVEKISQADGERRGEGERDALNTLEHIGKPLIYPINV